MIEVYLLCTPTVSHKPWGNRLRLLKWKKYYKNKKVFKFFKTFNDFQVFNVHFKKNSFSYSIFCPYGIY